MKVEIEHIDACVRRVTIEVPVDKVNQEFGTAYNDLQKRVRMPGFRQGKVPRRLLENYYRQTVEQDVLRKLVPEALTEVFTKENVASVGEPQIDQITLVKGEPLRFVATTQVIPEFTLTDYKGWAFERRIPAVTPAHIERTLETIRARHAILQTVDDRPVREGDVVIIDYTGSVEGQPVPGFMGTKVSVELGTGQALPEIEEGLIGLSRGEAKDITVHFPADSRNVALAGKVGACHVVVSEYKEKQLPVLDDDFARTVYDDVESLEGLRDRVQQELEKAAQQQADATVQQAILARLVSTHPLDVPEVLVNEEMRRVYLQQRRQETDGRLTEADYQAAPDSLRATFGEQALEAVRGQIILRHIAEQAELNVTSEEVDAEVASLAGRAAQNPEALKKSMERNGSLRALESGLLEAKVFARLKEDMHITDTVVTDDPATDQAEQTV